MSDWDVDSYKTSHESKEHWQLRKSFMDRWKHKFPEDRLVCLARVFVNIELMGCRYPSEVMALIAELSKEVAHNYRESRKSKLRRTFVSASDAAGDKAKGIKRNAREQTCSQAPPMKKLASEETKSTILSHNFNQSINTKTAYLNRFQKASNDVSEKDEFSNRLNLARPSFSQYNEIYRSQFSDSNNMSHQYQGFGSNSHSKRNNKDRMFRERPRRQEDCSNVISSQYGNLVLYDRDGSFYAKLLSSTQTCKVPFDCDVIKENDQWTCTIKINNIIISKKHSTSQKESKEMASQDAWLELKKKVYTLVIKQKHTSQNDSIITLQDVNLDKTKDNLIDGLDTKVDSAVATKMMNLMGWTGGALGTTGDGICEPILPNIKQIKRAGLGSNVGSATPITDALRKILREFSYNGCVDYDLVFASDFTKEERAVMHKIAQSMHLKSKSYGKDENRYIVISKPLEVGRLVKNLIESGGSNQKYDLIPPSGK